MTCLRVRRASKYNNLKRKLHGVVRLPDDWIGRNVIVLKTEDYGKLSKQIHALQRRIKKANLVLQLKGK